MSFETAFSAKAYKDRMYYSPSVGAHGGHSTYCGKHLPISWHYDPTVEEISDLTEYDYCESCNETGGKFTEEYVKNKSKETSKETSKKQTEWEQFLVTFEKAIQRMNPEQLEEIKKLLTEKKIK